MATFYFNSAVNNDLATLGNWWMDSAYTIAATALPTVFDDAIINGPVSSNSGSDITLSNLTVNASYFLFFSSFSGALTVTGVATFNDNANVSEGNINGNCIFNNNSNNNTFITGNCTFNDGSYNNFGVITGDCTLNDNSYNSDFGTITGDCTFNNTSYNRGTINGDCAFNDNATNYVIDGAAWYVGTVNGNCTFSLSSAALSIDAALAQIKTSDSITGTVGFKYEKGINGSSILGVV